MAQVRRGLRAILRDHCQLGAVILPAGDLIKLGAEALPALAIFLQKNGLWTERHNIYFDTQVFAHLDGALALAREYPPLRGCRFYFEQAARRVLGIQLAQLAAHTCATMLLEAFDLAKETGGGEEVRHAFFSGGLTRNTGLHFSSDCSDGLRFVAESHLTHRRPGAPH